MKFYVTRTCRKDYSQPPCAGAYVPESERDKNFPNWYIEINTPEDLVALSKQEGHELVVSYEADMDTPYLEIYDGYRE